MKTIAGIILFTVILQMTGCAAMFHGTSDQVTIQSAEPDAKIYLDNQLIGKGTAVATVKRNTIHTIAAKKRGCADNLAQTQTSFDSVSLLGILVDFGVVSMLVVDWAGTGAMWKIDPLVYHVTPICDEPEPVKNSHFQNYEDNTAENPNWRGALRQPEAIGGRADRSKRRNSACMETERGVICREQPWSAR